MELKNRQLLKEIDYEIETMSVGASLDEAVGGLFRAMRSKLLKEFGKPVILMQAKEVYFIETDVKKETERFMFLFWPREKTQYKIKAKIIVTVKYLDVAKEDI